MEVCSVDNCDNKQYCEAFCKKHYNKNKVSTEYRAWASMKYRCFNKNCKKYNYYGGRGIAVCDEWRDSAKAFLEYIGKKPTPQHSLDRINNNGNYEPGNVRWATKSEQMNNRRLYKSNVSGYSGITLDKSFNIWVLRVRINNKQQTIGRYKNINDAVNARCNIIK